MKSWIGLDPSLAAVRWTSILAENERETKGVTYRLCGCPRSKDYLSGDSWGDPLASKGHCFESLGDGIDKTGDYKFVEVNSTEWMRGYFSGNSCACPPIDPQSVLTLAIPNTTDVRMQDAYLGNLPIGYRKTYLLWRPIAIVLSWMNRLDDGTRNDYEGCRVFVLDFDGGYPELSELKLKRHKKQTDWIVPARRPPRPVEELQSGKFDDALLDAAFSSNPEYRQLMSGICASRMQELLESRETKGDVWIRKNGAWRHPTIEIPKTLDRDVLKNLNLLFKGVHLKSDDILLLNGWAARRFRRQFEEIFSSYDCQLEIVEADSVSLGASLFSRRIDLGLPTYYDIIPDYRFFDSINMDWVKLFSSGEDVEPGSQLQARTFDNLVMKKNDDAVSIYVQNVDEKTPTHYARKLKVMLSRLANEDIPLSMTATVQVARGSAVLRFSMCDAKQSPIFIVDKKPSKTLEFRYSVERGAQVSGDWEPEHRGYPEPQPVLGRIYDSEENIKMAEEWFEVWVKGIAPLEDISSFRTYKTKYGIKATEDMLLVRCGYSARDGREPTRGLLGTKRLPNMPRVDAIVEKLSTVGYGGKRYWQWQNFCHSFADNDYKKKVRGLLQHPPASFSTLYQAYAPGYVLGDDPADIVTLLKCIIGRDSSANGISALWWSVFRMLCWHPESRLDDAKLAEEALWKLVKSDVHSEHNANDLKFFSLAILYLLRLRESGADYSPALVKSLRDLFTTGVLAHANTPQTMMGNFTFTISLPEYIVRFLDRKDTIQDRELGAKLGGE
jgi:hypothetical protein